MDSVIARYEYEENIISLLKKIPSSEKTVQQQAHKQIVTKECGSAKTETVAEKENLTPLGIYRETVPQPNLKS